MTPGDPTDLLRLKLASPRGTELTAGCLDDDSVAALAEGTLDDPSRVAALHHLATCARCRGAVSSVSRALVDPSIERDVKGIEGRGRTRFYRIALPAAAAAALLVLALPRLADDRQAPHRAPLITSATAPVPLSPVGTVAQATALRWAAVPGADRYRVTLFDTTGRVLYEIQLADTVAGLPDSVGLLPRQRYFWKVEARIGFDRWYASELIEFSLGEAAR